MWQILTTVQQQFWITLTLDILFLSNHNIHQSSCSRCFWTSDPSIDFTNIFQLKGLKPKNKCYTNFYECCDLTKKKLFFLAAVLGKSIAVVYHGYAMARSRWEVELAFCTLHTITSRVTWAVFPYTLLVLCWHGLALR